MEMLSLLFGGLLRLAPEVVSFLNKRTDNAHEIAMLDKQVALEQTRSSARVHEAQVNGDINQQIELIRTQGIAIKSQMQKTGIRWVDAMNFLVRPLTTYYFLFFYGLVKTATVITAMQSATPWDAITQCWTVQDGATLYGILGFWFVGRVFDKKQS